MTSVIKFSQFPNAGALSDAARLAGLNNGENAIWEYIANGGGGNVISVIDADTTGLTVGKWVRINNPSLTPLYTNAIATSALEAEVEGVVLSIISPTQFLLQQAGRIPSGTPGFSGFTPGIYFLSDTILGGQSLNPPTTNGYVRKAVFAADSADSGWVIPLMLGVIIGSPGPIPPSLSSNDSNFHTVSQPGNIFTIGQFVRVSGNNVYSLADATTYSNAQSIGAITQQGDPNFTLQFAGYNSNTITQAVDATGVPVAITSSTLYYLSEIVPGAICPTKPLLPNSYSRPVYVSESSTNGTGYILPQRPLAPFVDSAGASPWVFLGNLDEGNSFSDTSILTGYKAFFLLFNTTDGPLQITGGAPSGIGLQVYVNGLWRITNHSTYIFGINSSAGLDTGTLWTYVRNSSSPNNIVLFPPLANNPAMGTGYAYLTNNDGVHSLSADLDFADTSSFPSVGYVSQISSVNGTAGLATGLRLFIDGPGSIVPASGFYISVYGLPNS